MLIALLIAGVVAATPQAKVGPGIWRPIEPASESQKEVRVEAFLLDVVPVTNAQFLAFVTEHPAWRRDRIPALLADERYLARWAGPTDLGIVLPDAPVVEVSWHAAEAYCAAMDRRLPTTAEWELAAMADETRADATADPVYRQRILDWYARPAGEPLRRVGMGPANAWGIRDLHGLAWEWVDDFQSALGAGDARNDQNEDRLRICGITGLAGGEKTDYAAFMRLALRSSLRGRSTTSTLGFRCAADVDGAKETP